jgi:hypothetical protein
MLLFQQRPLGYESNDPSPKSENSGFISIVFLRPGVSRFGDSHGSTPIDSGYRQNGEFTKPDSSSCQSTSPDYS